MALVAGAKAIGADFQNLEVQEHAPLDTGTTTSTTFTTTRSGATSPVGVTFVAPPSGKVLVSWGCGLINGTTGGTAFTLCSYRIGTGTSIGAGTSVVGGNDNEAIQRTQSSTANGEIQSGRTALVTGLTPGNDYNAALVYRVGTNTGTISRVSIVVTPCIA